MCKRFAFLLFPVLFYLVSCGSTPKETTAPDVSKQDTQVTAAPSPRQSLLEAVLEKVRQGDYEAALALFDEFPDEYAASTDAAIMKSGILLSSGKANEARSTVNALIETKDPDANAYWTLASIERAVGNEKAEKAALEKALGVNPSHVASLVSMGEVSMRNNAFKTAATYLDKALTIDKDNVDALLDRAEVYRQERDTKNALALAERALAISPNTAEVHTTLANLHKAESDFKAALHDLETADALAPNNYWINYDKGRILVAMSRKTDALECFEKSIVLNPNEFAAYIYSAGISADLGKYELSEARYTKLAQLNPNYYFAYEGLGMLQMKRKDYKGARESFIRAYAKNPDESSYAVLASLSALRVQKPFEVKPFIETVLKTMQKGSLNYSMLRLLFEFTGDTTVTTLIDKEKDAVQKSKMSFYMAEFYDIQGKPTLANAYYEKCREINRRNTIEWRLNEWKMQERNLLVGF